MKPVTVVVDDREEERTPIANKVRERGHRVVEAASKKEAKEKIGQLLREGEEPHILTDLDLTRKFYRVREKWGGYQLAKWAHKQGIPGDKITLHSTSLEEGHLMKPIHNMTIVPKLRRMGIRAAPKSEIMGGKMFNRPKDIFDRNSRKRRK
jgi:CheY-like chemotaxis protein